MKKVSYILVILFILGIMEGTAWTILTSSKEGSETVPPVGDKKEDSRTQSAPVSEEPQQDVPTETIETPTPQAPFLGSSNTDPASFPPPSTEVVTAKKGELVRLVVHNADVKHGLVIPELNVLNVDIPSEGTVIEFEASKAGSFEFFCSYYCGEGHMEMRGSIRIE